MATFSMNIVTATLLLGHLAIAGVILFALSSRYYDREGEVSQLRELTERERQLTHEHNQQVQVYEALLEGVRANDPYVIELLARERLGYRHREQREVPPPRLD